MILPHCSEMCDEGGEREREMSKLGTKGGKSATSKITKPHTQL